MKIKEDTSKQQNVLQDSLSNFYLQNSFSIDWLSENLNSNITIPCDLLDS